MPFHRFRCISESFILLNEQIIKEEKTRLCGLKADVELS